MRDLIQAREEAKAMLISIVLSFMFLICLSGIGFLVYEETKNNEVKYLAHVELPNGENETYEVVRYETYLLGDCVLVLEDGKKIITQEDRVVIETIDRDKE